MPKFILLLLILLSSILSAQVFEIKAEEYISTMLFLGSIDIGNNYIDDMMWLNRSNKKVDSSDWDIVPFFDNWISSKTDKKLKDLSDYSYISLLTASLALTFDKDYFSTNILVLGKILLAQSATGKWVKSFTQRYRPYSFHGAQGRQNRHSFYSLHSSGAFAIATFTYYHYFRKKGPNLLLAGLLYGGASLTASLRVASAQHFPSDVVAGALAGSFISYLICRYHHNSKLEIVTSYSGLGVSYRF